MQAAAAVGAVLAPRWRVRSINASPGLRWIRATLLPINALPDHAASRDA